jgi:glutamine amidotransferase
MSEVDVAIIDYGLGNLFSVKQACESVGISATITRDTQEIRAASGLILPGVGAYGRAMDRLRDLKLIEEIRRAPEVGQPLVGICLGAQLLMSESEEFGRHDGLDLIPGTVRRLDDVIEVQTEKVPHVGWERVYHQNRREMTINGINLFEGIENGEYLYFVHSYCIETDTQNVTAETPFAADTFCSAVGGDGVAGFQFHPERSGGAGLQIYRNIRRMLEESDSNA